MKRIQRAILLFSLVFITACNGAAFFDQEPLKLTTHHELKHLLNVKELPKGYFLEPLTDVDIEARAGFLLDAERGRVLFEKNSHESLGIASMSKIMSELLVLEAIDEGMLGWEDQIPISDYAYTISHQPGFASMELEQDETYSVRDLFHGMAITSANGATIALAEAVAGSEKEFVGLMNETAIDMGLEDSHFVNSTGLTNNDLQDYHSTGSIDDYNEMSASDLAHLAKYVIDRFPELLEVTRLTEFDIQGNPIENSNWMLPGAKENFLGVDVTYEGVDGLKTGYTSQAGYGFTGTAVIEGTRFISVVIGTEGFDDRFIQTAKLYRALE